MNVVFKYMVNDSVLLFRSGLKYTKKNNGLYTTQTGQPETPLQRSGNPGYLDGLPVLAGTVSDGYPLNSLHAALSFSHTHCILIMINVSGA